MCIFTKKFRTFDVHPRTVWDKVQKKKGFIYTLPKLGKLLSKKFRPNKLLPVKI